MMNVREVAEQLAEGHSVEIEDSYKAYELIDMWISSDGKLVIEATGEGVHGMTDYVLDVDNTKAVSF